MYFAKVTRAAQLKLEDRDFGADLLRAINPSHKVIRYGRLWRFARPAEVDGFILGKLGFTHEGEEQRTEYDERAQDFVTDMAPASQTYFSHWVADVATEVLAFEDRGRLIRRQSFIGAFQGLTEIADFDASVELLSDPTSLGAWAATVERVLRIRAVVHNPNPGWVRDAGAIRQLVVETDAESADITVKAAPEAGLNVTAEWVSGALQQISHEGQGTMTAMGVRHGRESRWTLGDRPRMEKLDEDLEDESATIWSKIIELLRAFRGI